MTLRNLPHRFEVFRRTVVGENEGAPVHKWVSWGELPGMFAVLDADEAPLWQGQKVEASMRVPHSTTFVTTDRVRVIYPPAGKGLWQVVSVRHQVDHQRVFLKRMESNA